MGLPSRRDEEISRFLQDNPSGAQFAYGPVVSLPVSSADPIELSADLGGRNASS